MAFSFTLWDLLPIAAWLGLAYAGPVLLAVAALFLAVPALRQHTGTRRTAYGLLSLVVLLAVGASPFLAWRLGEWRRDRAWDARTLHLAVPQTLGGIAFPAGSTVHVAEDGTPEFGSVPVPTPMLGLPLVGEFRLGADYGTDPSGVREGTLAAAIDIHGVPCGPGLVVSQRETTRCTLARDWVFTGHLLAAGTVLEVYRSPLDRPPELRFGFLARPELLYDVRWPAGTAIGPVHEPPERMAHEAGPKSGIIELCLPSGVMADIGGAVLHGFLAYSVQGDRRRVSPVCSILPGNQVGTDGYAQVGPDRFSWGERPDASSRWQWTTPFKPDEQAAP